MCCFSDFHRPLTFVYGNSALWQYCIPAICSGETRAGFSAFSGGSRLRPDGGMGSSFCSASLSGPGHWLPGQFCSNFFQRLPIMPIYRRYRLVKFFRNSPPGRFFQAGKDDKPSFVRGGAVQGPHVAQPFGRTPQSLP